MFDFDNLREIFGTMKRNKLRTFLTGFAVSWGIFILIILLGAGNGLRNGVMKNFENWSQNRIVIYAGSTDKPYAGFQRGRRIRFTYKDFEDLSVFFPEIDKKTVEQYLSDTLKYNNEYSVVSLRGVHPAKAEIDFLKMESGNGRFINEIDVSQQRKVVVISQRTKEILFKEENPMQYLVKSEREQLNRFSLYFSAKADTLPTIKGLDFDEKDAFIIESNPRNDTIRYWIKDTVMCERDTLTFQMDYLATDTLGQLVPKTDTLRMVNKIDKKRRMALAEEALKKEEKERKKRAKKGDTLKVEPKFFAMSVDAPSNLDLNRNIVLKFEEPVEHIDTAAIHMAVKVDSLWEDIPFILMADSVVPRQYQILADWQPGQEYQLKIDSLGIKGIYGLYTNKVENQLKVKTLEDYGTLYLNIVGAGPHAIVQLLNSSDGVVRQQPVTDKNTCDFYFLQPSTKYYIRLFNDDNNNGVWDTGNYEEKRQPEEVYYFPKVWEMKANFEFEETWDIHAVPLDKQKLDEIKKQKPDEAKKIKDRNKERARKLGRT